MTLAERAITVSLLAGLGLVASRLGLSAIPAYLLAGLLLGAERAEGAQPRPPVRGDGLRRRDRACVPALLPRPRVHARPDRSQPPASAHRRGDRFRRERRPRARDRGGCVRDQLRLARPRCGDLRLVERDHRQGTDRLRRVADDETDLVLAILVAEDLVIGLVLGFASGGGGAVDETLALVGKAIAFVAAALAISKWLSGMLDRLLDWLPRESFLLATFALLMGAAALAKEVGLSEAVGALMAGVVLSETSVREEIEERFFSFRDVFAALFFFVFGLSMDVARIRRVPW